MKRKTINVVLGFMIILGIITFVGFLGSGISYAQQVQGITDKEIKIGLFNPLTGPTALYGKGSHMDDAIYKELVNERGGIHGRKIVTTTEDDACDPIKGVAAVKKLIHQDKVFMLHGGRCSNVVLAVKKEILESGIPYMGDGAANYRITYPVTKNIFTGVFTSMTVAKTMADFAMSKPGAKRIAVIKHTDEWGKGFYEPIMEYLKGKYGITPVADVTIESGVTDATPQILQIKNANPDVIIAITYVIPTSTFLRDCYKLAVKVPIVGNPAVHLLEQNNRVGIPDALKLFFAPYYFKYPLDHPVMDKWRIILQKHYPKDIWDEDPGLSIGGAMVIIEALKRAGRDLTWEKFINALESIKDFNPEDYPMAVPITFSPTDHVGLEAVNFGLLVDGKLKIVSNWKDYEEVIKSK